MEIGVLNIEGQETGRNIELIDAIFGIEPNDHAMYLDVKLYLANQRQGTSKSKERAEIKGSTRKIKRQKGTGTARAGSIKSPTFRGGGRVFGPRPRNYGFKLNKKLRTLARKSALAFKATEKSLFVIENLNFDAPKTQKMLNMLVNLKMNDKKTLIVLSEENKNIYLSARNLQGIDVIIASELNTYSILRASSILFVEDSVKKVEEFFKI